MLTTCQIIWSKIYSAFGENDFYMDVIGSNILTFLVFWSTSGIFALVDVTGWPAWMLQYKSQPGKNQPVDRSKLLNAVRVALINQLFIGIPVSILTFFIRQRLAISCQTSDIPSFLNVIKDLAIFTIIEEIGFYYTHRLIHTGPLYRAIHKKHHEWTAPVGLVAIYAHPVEFVLSNLFPVLLGPLLMRSHLLTTWTWLTVGLVTTVIHHCGYHLPFFPSNEFHDYHHLKFTCNYGLTGWLDYLHGTDKQYRSSAQHSKDHVLVGFKPA